MKQLLILTSILCLMSFNVGCEMVPTGHVGVQTLFGEVTGDVYPEGLNIMAPWYNVDNVTVQQQNLDFVKKEGTAISAPASDKTTVSFDTTVIFYLDADKDRNTMKNAAPVRQKLGVDWMQKIMVANVRSGLRDAVKEFTALEAATGSRDQVAARAKAIIQHKVSALLKERDIPERAVVVQAVELRNPELPKAIQDSILAVQAQKMREAEREMSLKTEKMEQERRLIEQQGETAVVLEQANRRAEQRRIDAESIALYNRKVDSSLTDKLLRQQAIDATREIVKSQNSTVFLGNPNGSMLFNMPTNK